MKRVSWISQEAKGCDRIDKEKTKKEIQKQGNEITHVWIKAISENQKSNKSIGRIFWIISVRQSFNNMMSSKRQKMT